MNNGAPPPVSVVLPVRDAEAFLAETLASLRDQTFPDFEVVIHDDGSRDATREIVGSVMAVDARFRLSEGPGEGVAIAANRACEAARADLLVRIDGDDLARPERLERLVELAAEHPEVGFFGSRVRFFPREAVGPGTQHYEAWLNGLLSHEDILVNRYVEYPVPNPTVALRRGVFDQLGGYRQGPFPEDYDFFLRAVAAGVRFLKHPDVLLDQREGEHRTTRSDPRYGLDRFHTLKVEQLVPELEKLGRPVAVVGAGPDGKRWACSLTAAGRPPTWFVDVHPRRIGQMIHGAQVLGYDEIDQATDAFFLGAVGAKGGRDQVRDALSSAGLVEADDFLCVQ